MERHTQEEDSTRPVVPPFPAASRLVPVIPQPGRLTPTGGTDGGPPHDGSVEIGEDAARRLRMLLRRIADDRRVPRDARGRAEAAATGIAAWSAPERLAAAALALVVVGADSAHPRWRDDARYWSDLLTGWLDGGNHQGSTTEDRDGRPPSGHQR